MLKKRQAAGSRDELGVLYHHHRVSQDLAVGSVRTQYPVGFDFAIGTEDDAIVYAVLVYVLRASDAVGFNALQLGSTGSVANLGEEEVAVEYPATLGNAEMSRY
jgi:hypothetical protein